MPKAPHARLQAQAEHPGSGHLSISSRGMKLPAGAWPGCPGHVVLVFISAVSAEQ